MLQFFNLLSLLFIPLFSVPINGACASPRRPCVTKASPRLLATISLQLYENQRFDNYTAVLAADASNLFDKIDCSRPTVLYITGWTEKTESLSVEAVLGAYFQRRDHNVILANYYQIAKEAYTFAVLSADGVARALAQALNILVSNGLDPSTVHVIGHSLGAQIAGRIGKHANFCMARITGLDPAGPLFDFTGENLSHRSAKFVDTIHTDAGFYGSNMRLGTVDFYPNGGGRPQPGCPSLREPMSNEDFCDHHRSWHYYAESLINENAFVGLKCNSYMEFQSGYCDLNERAVMGYATPTTAKGGFYLETNSESTYGRGRYGARYRSRNSSTSATLSASSPYSYGR